MWVGWTDTAARRKTANCAGTHDQRARHREKSGAHRRRPRVMATSHRSSPAAGQPGRIQPTTTRPLGRAAESLREAYMEGEAGPSTPFRRSCGLDPRGQAMDRKPPKEAMRTRRRRKRKDPEAGDPHDSRPRRWSRSEVDPQRPRREVCRYDQLPPRAERSWSSTGRIRLYGN
jgi:hypothetical protein